MQKHSKKFFSCDYTIYFSLLCLLLFTSILFITNSFAQSVTGLYQNYTAFQFQNDYELVAGRNRLRGEFNQPLSWGGVYAEIDLIDRYTENHRVEILPRELYLDWYTPDFDIRIGKQKIIWGEVTGTFINDILTPFDLREFLTQAPEDLRIGVTAVNVKRYFGNNYLQFVISPAIQSNLLPPSESRWFPVRRPQTIIPFNFRPSDEQPSLSDIQAAIRFAWRPKATLTIDFMLYHWAHPMPAYSIQPRLNGFTNSPEITLRESYKTSAMAGYSLSWQFSDKWIASAEGLLVNERQFTFLPVPVNRLEDALNNPSEASLILQEFDLREDGYVLTKPWIQQMAGIQTDIQDVKVGIQGILEIILNYEDRILPQKLFPYASGFAQTSIYRERLNVLLTGRYHLLGKDYWTQLQAGYEIRDGFEITLGTNLFGGPETSSFYGHLTFQQFSENSFIFAQSAIYF